MFTRIFAAVFTICLTPCMKSGNIHDYTKLEVQANNRSERHNINEHLRGLEILRPSDQDRIYDCTDNADGPAQVTMKPLYSRFRNFDYFNRSQLNQITGFYRFNEYFAMLVHLHNYQLYERANTDVFIGIRGLGWGIHKSSLASIFMDNLAAARPDDVLMLIDDYAIIDPEKPISSARLVSICHNNKYNGIYVGNYWPVLEDGMGWNLVNTMFSGVHSIHIVGYSNGASPRAQFTESVPHASFDERRFYSAYTINDISDYSIASDYKYGESNISRIKSMWDIETNYGTGKVQFDLLKLIYEKFYLDQDASRLYYASLILDNNQISNVVVRNHVMMIKIFNLKGRMMADGFIRYSNANKNIVIDIQIDKARTFRRGDINLLAETEIENPYDSINRVSLSHATIGKYTVKYYLELLKNLEL